MVPCVPQRWTTIRIAVTTIIVVVMMMMLMATSSSNNGKHQVHAITILDGTGWTNFSLSPRATSGWASPIIFVPNGVRGGGTLTYVSMLGDAVFGINIEPYKYGHLPPVMSHGPNPPSVRLTLDDISMGFCPSSWYNPPPNYTDIVNVLARPSENQTAQTRDMFIKSSALALDPQSRLLISSNPFQLMLRVEASGQMMQHNVANPKQVFDPSTNVSGAFTVSVLWGGWCNGTHNRYTNRPAPPQDFPPESGQMSLTEVLRVFIPHDVHFLNDGSVVFALKTFPCLFQTGASTAWRVMWFAGNCSDTNLQKTPDEIEQIVIKKVHKSAATLGGIRTVLYDSRESSERIFIASNYGVVFQLDVASGDVQLVMGNVSSFFQVPIVCDASAHCSPFATQFHVQNMALHRGPKVKSSASSSGGVTQETYDDTLYVHDAAFQTVYSLNLRTHQLVTEMAIPQTSSSRTDCRATSVTTSPADLFIMCNDGQRVFRKRLLPPDALPEAAKPLPLLDQVSITTITAFTTLTAIVSVPTVAISAGRARAVIALARCEISMSRNEPLTWAESPTQLAIGDGEFRYVMGCVVGNILVIVVPIILHAVVVQVMVNRRRRQLEEEEAADTFDFTALLADLPSQHSPKERARTEVEAQLRFPSGSFVFAFMFVTEPTVRAAAFLMRFADGGAFIVGVIAEVVIAGGIFFVFCFFLYHFTAQFYPVPVDQDDDDDDKKKVALLLNNDGDAGNSSSKLQSLSNLVSRWYTKLRRWTHPFGEWRDHKNMQHKRFGGIIKPYTERGKWWSIAELMSAAMLAGMVGFKTKDTCTATAIATVVVLWVFFLAGIRIAPMASPFDNFFQSIVAGLEAFSGFFVLMAAIPFVDEQDVISASFSLAATLALTAAYLIGVEAFVEIATRAFKVIKYLTDKWCPAPPSLSSDGKNQPAVQSAVTPVGNVFLADANTLNTTPSSNEAGSMKNASFTSLDRRVMEALRQSSTDSSDSSANPNMASRVASSDMDLLETVARQIKKDTKRHHKFDAVQQQRSGQQQQQGKPSATPVNSADSAALSPPAPMMGHPPEADPDVVLPSPSQLQDLNQQHSYALDDDFSDPGDDAGGGKGDDAGAATTVNKAERKRQRELMEYEIMRQNLEKHLDHGVAAQHGSINATAESAQSYEQI